ncbi:unnamed protein product [Effrenium voratum]|uniref:Uncharacterized protein n=1 Tax=Effrenium voratum TaxID=2562239 RepID=A0AA36JDH9_9DINO|nr:unnamed protein product [Effrenium voratum]
MLLGHVASSASTMLSLTTAGLAGQGALGGPSPRPGSARSARSVKSTAMDDPNALWRLTRRLQYRARPSRALEDLRRVRVLLDVDDGPLPFGVQSLESTSPEEFEEASAAAKERRLLLAGLVLAAADLAFLALPQRLHQAWAELAADERELGMAARQWLRGLAETLAIPLYDTLRTLEELTHGRGPSNRQPLAVPLHHLRDNARHWTKHMLAPQSKRRSLRSSVAESQTSLRDFLVKSSGDLERDVLRAESTTLPKGAQVPPPPMPDLPGQINEVATWDSDTSRGWDSSSNADLWA